MIMCTYDNRCNTTTFRCYWTGNDSKADEKKTLTISISVSICGFAFLLLLALGKIYWWDKRQRERQRDGTETGDDA